MAAHRKVKSRVIAANISGKCQSPSGVIPTGRVFRSRKARQMNEDKEHELRVTLAHYESLRLVAQDRVTLKAIDRLIADLRAKLRECHPA